MQYLKRFAVTGSLCPSTRFFGERAASEVLRLSRQYDRVVVAGIGSGVVADRICRLCPDAVFVECEARFAEPFARRHPQALVIEARLEELFDHVPDLRGERVLVASFIPTAGNFYSDEIVRLFVQVCRLGGTIIQMRYLPHRMSARFFDGLTDRGIVSERLFTVARNLPPVSMFALRSRLAPVPTVHQLRVVHGAAVGHAAVGHAVAHSAVGHAAVAHTGVGHAVAHAAVTHASVAHSAVAHASAKKAAAGAGPR